MQRIKQLLFFIRRKWMLFLFLLLFIVSTITTAYASSSNTLWGNVPTIGSGSSGVTNDESKPAPSYYQTQYGITPTQTNKSTNSGTTSSSSSASTTQSSTNKLADPSNDPSNQPGWSDSNWIEKQIASILYGVNKGLYGLVSTPKDLIGANVPGGQYKDKGITVTNTNSYGVFEPNKQDQINIIAKWFYYVSYVAVVAIFMLHGIRKTTIGTFNPNVRFAEMQFYQDFFIGLVFLLFGQTFLKWVLEFSGELAIALANFGGSSADLIVNMPDKLLQEVVQLVLILAMIVLWLLYVVRAVLLSIILSFWPLVGLAYMHEKTKGFVQFWLKEFAAIALLPVVHGFIVAMFGVFLNKGAGAQNIPSKFNTDVQTLLYVLYGLGGVIVFAGFIWSSVQMALSKGNPQKRANAIKGYVATSVGGFFVFGAFKLRDIAFSILPGGANAFGNFTFDQFNTLTKTILYAGYSLGGVVILGSFVYTGVQFAASRGRVDARTNAWYGLVGVVVGIITLAGTGTLTAALQYFAVNGS